MITKELKYDEPLTDKVNDVKKQIAKLTGVDPDELKLVGITFSLAQKDEEFTTECKIWSKKEYSVLFDKSPDVHIGVDIDRESKEVEIELEMPKTH